METLYREAGTYRQQEALAAVIRTGTVSRAAQELGIEEQTVKNHLFALYRELGVHTMTGAALALGWLHIPPDFEPPA